MHQEGTGQGVTSARVQGSLLEGEGLWHIARQQAQQGASGRESSMNKQRPQDTPWGCRGGSGAWRAHFLFSGDHGRQHRTPAGRPSAGRGGQSTGILGVRPGGVSQNPSFITGRLSPPVAPRLISGMGQECWGALQGSPKLREKQACASRRWCPSGMVLGARAGARPRNWEAQPVAGAEGVVQPRRPGRLGEWPVPGAPSSGLWVHSMLSQLHPDPGMAGKVSQGAGVGAPAGFWAVCVWDPRPQA